MHFSLIAISLTALSGALAQTNVQVIAVSSNNGSLTYMPNSVKANVGDMLQFQFHNGNHTVTQSTFDAPCMPMGMSSSNGTQGIFSGFQPVKPTDQNVPVYTVMVTSMTPMWMYCSQAKHCQSGMVMVVNENTSANSTRSLDQFKQLAAKASVNLAPSGGATGGTASTTQISGSATSSSSASGAKVTTKTSSDAVQAAGFSNALRFAGAVALGMALLI